MESSTNPKATQQRELSKAAESQVSTEIWQDLLHTAIVGNGIFPQSFFPQGLLLSDKMANLVHERRASLGSLQKEDSPRELISTMFIEAKNKGHGAYGFQSSQSMMEGNIANVWGSDKSQALEVLRNFSNLIGNTNADASQESNENESNRQQVLQKVFSNPQELSLLLELLGVARQSLLSQTTRETSANYRGKISDFMKKYSKHEFYNIPEGYRAERKDLMAKLAITLRETATSIKEALVLYVDRQYPQNKILLERLKGSDDRSLFGGLLVTNIDPLRNPDYE